MYGVIVCVYLGAASSVLIPGLSVQITKCSDVVCVDRVHLQFCAAVIMIYFMLMRRRIDTRSILEAVCILFICYLASSYVHRVIEQFVIRTIILVCECTVYVSILQLDVYLKTFAVSFNFGVLMGALLRYIVPALYRHVLIGSMLCIYGLVVYYISRCGFLHLMLNKYKAIYVLNRSVYKAPSVSYVLRAIPAVLSLCISVSLLNILLRRVTTNSVLVFTLLGNLKLRYTCGGYTVRIAGCVVVGCFLLALVGNINALWEMYTVVHAAVAAAIKNYVLDRFEYTDVYLGNTLFFFHMLFLITYYCM